jgi:hypothetical protein
MQKPKENGPFLAKNRTLKQGAQSRSTTEEERILLLPARQAVLDADNRQKRVGGAQQLLTASWSELN